MSVMVLTLLVACWLLPAGLLLALYLKEDPSVVDASPVLLKRRVPVPVKALNRRAVSEPTTRREQAHRGVQPPAAAHMVTVRYMAAQVRVADSNANGARRCMLCLN
ncbi:hypothetical protein [Salisaeta longa]|uniref:hypothetical protein n=1 Tax=Salisaeta longa TaxID=503170 RepID=UPI0003F70359|nr:hypothetical protein [Salisaeta longa]